MAKTPPFSLCNEFCVGGGGASNAKDVKYDNTTSGLKADNVGGAIDEICAKMNDIDTTQIPCITGKGAPTTTTEGAVGCLYMDTDSDNKDIYKCIDVSDDAFTWILLSGELFDFEYSPNLFDLNSVHVGKVILRGNLSNATQYNTTDYIPCKPGDVIRHQFDYQGIRWDNSEKGNLTQIPRIESYDENKNYIEDSFMQAKTSYTVPEGASFVRLSYINTNWNTGDFSDSAIIISDESTVIPFSEYGSVIKKIIKREYVPLDDIEQKVEKNADDISAIKETLENISNGGESDVVDENLFNYEYSPNMLDLESVQVGKVILNGGLYDAASYTTTDYIPCKPGDVLRIQYDYNGSRVDSISHRALTFNRIEAYDENKNYIADSMLQTKNSYTAPEGASFVRVSYNNQWNGDVYSNCAIIISDTGVIYPFSEYGSLISKTIKSEFIPNNPVVKAFLPKEICVAVGRTIELYNNQVCINADKYHIRWDCAIGQSLERKYSVVGVESLIGNYRLTLNIMDDDLNNIWSDDTIVKIVPATTESFSICCIGDSLTNNKPWLDELKVLNNNITLVGTKGVNQLMHEGRSGFSAASYLKATDYTFENEGIHPFWNPTAARFDWNYYVTNSLNGVSPDAVQIFLGTNGIKLDATKAATDIKQMIDYILQDDADMPIFVVNTLYRSNQDGIGKQIGNDGYTVMRGLYKYEEDVKVLNLMIKLDEVLSDYENVYFVPVATCHDSANNYGKVEVTVNPRTTDKEYMPIESVHPQTQGYLQMADIMFSALSAHMSLDE